MFLMTHEELEAKRYLEKLQDRERETGVATYIHTSAGLFFLAQVFEAKTVKGGTNYIYFSQVRQGWVYYVHGQRAKKIRKEEFLKQIEAGDLIPVSKDKVDPERLSLASLGLHAACEGLSFGDYLKQIWGVGAGSNA